jgi:hypothetical protein
MADEEADAHYLMGYCYLKDEGMGKNCREAVCHAFSALLIMSTLKLNMSLEAAFSLVNASH